MYVFTAYALRAFFTQLPTFQTSSKGTGKSLLFRLFVEQPEQAKDLAQSDVDLSNVYFIPGHGEPRLLGPILESRDLASYEQQIGEDSWATFWLNYALLQLCHAQPELRSLVLMP